MASHAGIIALFIDGHGRYGEPVPEALFWPDEIKLAVNNFSGAVSRRIALR
jgi:hypothetical protein